MKQIYFFPLLLLAFFSCKKELSPEELQRQKLELEQQKLAAMRANLVKDWKIFKIMTVKPASQYGTISTSYCEDAATFSFKSDSSFNYIGNPACYSQQNIRGVWSLPKSDSLFITFTENWVIGAYEKLEVTKLTADTMKWNIIASTGNGNPNITQEYTLIPR
ncbi:MAG: lipocalin family protein [Sphingobacteriia bacterium]|nr:lipocalin family protein [Sphingobacteriia bacterium]